MGQSSYESVAVLNRHQQLQDDKQINYARKADTWRGTMEFGSNQERLRLISELQRRIDSPCPSLDPLIGFISTHDHTPCCVRGKIELTLFSKDVYTLEEILARRIVKRKQFQFDEVSAVFGAVLSGLEAHIRYNSKSQQQSGCVDDFLVELNPKKIFICRQTYRVFLPDPLFLRETRSMQLNGQPQSFSYLSPQAINCMNSVEAVSKQASLGNSLYALGVILAEMTNLQRADSSLPPRRLKIQTIQHNEMKQAVQLLTSSNIQARKQVFKSHYFNPNKQFIFKNSRNEPSLVKNQKLEQKITNKTITVKPKQNYSFKKSQFAGKQQNIIVAQNFRNAPIPQMHFGKPNNIINNHNAQINTMNINPTIKFIQNGFNQKLVNRFESPTPKLASSMIFFQNKSYTQNSVRDKQFMQPVTTVASTLLPSQQQWATNAQPLQQIRRDNHMRTPSFTFFYPSEKPMQVDTSNQYVNPQFFGSKEIQKNISLTQTREEKSKRDTNQSFLGIHLAAYDFTNSSFNSSVGMKRDTVSQKFRSSLDATKSYEYQKSLEGSYYSQTRNGSLPATQDTLRDDDLLCQSLKKQGVLAEEHQKASPTVQKSPNSGKREPCLINDRNQFVATEQIPAWKIMEIVESPDSSPTDSVVSLHEVQQASNTQVKVQLERKSMKEAKQSAFPEQEIVHPEKPLSPSSTDKAVTSTPPRHTNQSTNNFTIQEARNQDTSPSRKSEQPPERQNVKERYDSGSYYEGQKSGGIKNGFGRFYYVDGGHYEGQWRDNCMEGHGKLYYDNGKLAYEGDWKRDEFSGFGRIYNYEPTFSNEPFNYADMDSLDAHWISYEGSLRNDMRDGRGSIHFSNGERFEGDFYKDRIQGLGKYYNLDGKVVEAIWVDSKLLKVLNI